MMHFTVDAYTPVDSCQTCCCEKLKLVPGTTSKVTVGYAPWAAPIGQLHCVPQFMIEPLATCPPVLSGNLPPQPQVPVAFDVLLNTQLAGSLSIAVTDPEGDPLTYALLPLYGPHHGKLSIQPDGNFTYMPEGSYAGPDRFFVSVKDPSNAPVIFEVLLGVGVSSDTVVPTPPVSVGPASVDNRYYAVSFAITLSPAARACDMWKLTVRQAALDCECTCFTRNDCFDIGVAKC